MKIKSWFLEKKFNEGERMVIRCADLDIIEETEKAVQIYADSDYGCLKFWCPKSCIITDEEYAAIVEEETRRYDEQLKKAEIGLAKLEKLVLWAKENGVKGVRKGMRKVTVLAKIEAAGLVAPQF